MKLEFLPFAFRRIVEFACVLVFSASAAMAIPSPELVIGSVSSLSQIFGIAIATMTGTGAYVARRIGIRTPNQAGSFSKILLPSLGIMTVILIITVYLQFQNSRTNELLRLQQTLVRPAQFDGTVIQDADLIETNFYSQEGHPLAISTQLAAEVLDTSPETLFLDIRETGENLMGTLPGASHIRFPDISQVQGELHNKQVILFCHNGNRSSETCAKLAALGIDCKFIAGGIEKWLVEGRSLSDKSIEKLSDLRALPAFENDTTLLGTDAFSELFFKGDLQILDSRYPGDFGSGHLPGAINIPIRALPTEDLITRLKALENKPTIVACYDRRSCFMGQVLAYEMSQIGIPFLGRYTTPWEFFIPAPTKPHVEAWLLQNNSSLWEKGVGLLATLLARIAESTHLVLATVGLALVSRIIVLPITLKSERDQIVSSKYKQELIDLKNRLKSDPTRKARAIQQFYRDHGITPARNLLGLLFLPLMMLGLSAVERAAQINPSHVFNLDLGAPDPTLIIPFFFSICAGIYLQWVVAKSRRQAIVWFVVSTPIIFWLGLQLSAAGALYLSTSLALLLVQRAFVTGLLVAVLKRLQKMLKSQKRPTSDHGIYFFDATEALERSGNKSLRLAEMSRQDIPVPHGIVLTPLFIRKYEQANAIQKEWLADLVWKSVGEVKCAVRSSSIAEDGAESSFAGVFESVLNVERQSLLSALEQVIASFSANRVASYSDNHNGHSDANILVQQMVHAEFSGVLFTQDPSTLGLQMIEYVEGYGENLVSGNVTPTTVQFGRYSLLAADEHEGPLDLTPLLRLGQRIETLFGTPQDIEWAYAGGQFQILQSRDITTRQSMAKSASVEENELNRLYDLYAHSDPDAVVLEKDELSEVLPHPTPMSFDLMARLWSPGGSLDMACRRLGVPYNLPEGKPGHMVSVLGRLYVDTVLKDKTKLYLSRAKSKMLKKMAVRVRDDFLTSAKPNIANRVSRLRATNFEKLPHEQLLAEIAEIADEFTQNAYVDAESINVLAGFLFAEAYAATAEQPADRKRLMTPLLPNSPLQLMTACMSKERSLQQTALSKAMGHRAVIDYELSLPRYGEDPQSLAELARNVSAETATDLRFDPSDIVSMAIAYQDLKEHAKHETLKLVQQLRRAVVALSKNTQLDDLIFYLRLDEIQTLTQIPSTALVSELEKRKVERSILLNTASSASRLTLRDLELLSAPNLKASLGSGELSGSCVSGSGRVLGNVFKVDPSEPIETAFADFQDGDIIVCSVIDPNWLPYVQKSSGVLAEVGGWLSHMAIIAREAGVMMLVKCNGIMSLQTGQQVSLSDNGSIEVIEAATA